MIVQPDFLDHWKTLKLTSVLSDKLAPIYILRLWAYVQTSRRDIIPDDAEMLKAICRWAGDATVIQSALLSCGWVDTVEGGLRIHGWSELNARLIHNWTVGKHGGRPRVITDNPRDNPRVSQTKPIRVDKSRGDENNGIGIPIPCTDGKPEAVKRHSFKRWTRDDLLSAVQAANNDGLLLADEIADFIDYWTEPSASGKFRLAMEKTWDTRRRMQTAMRMVYEKRRKIALPGDEHPIRWVGGENMWVGITGADYERWGRRFPGVAVDDELVALSDWLVNKPDVAKRQSFRGLIDDWLARAKEKGGR